MQVGEVLIGMTSGARAVVQRRRHMTDRNGWYRGNFFIPPPVKNVNPRWRTGTRTLRMTSQSDDTRIPGAVASAGEVEFTSSELCVGFVETSSQSETLMSLEIQLLNVEQFVPQELKEDRLVGGTLSHNLS